MNCSDKTGYFNGIQSVYRTGFRLLPPLIDTDSDHSSTPTPTAYLGSHLPLIRHHVGYSSVPVECGGDRSQKPRAHVRCLASDELDERVLAHGVPRGDGGVVTEFEISVALVDVA